jgi:hypothetical protein
MGTNLKSRNLCGFFIGSPYLCAGKKEVVHFLALFVGT